MTHSRGRTPTLGRISLRQRGLTLIVSLIMLVVITLLAVYAIRSGNLSLKIVGNSQRQAEADAATDQVIEQVLEVIRMAGTGISAASMTALSTDVKNALPGAVPTVATIPAFTVTVPANGVNYRVTTNSMANNQCITERPLPNNELVVTNTDDQQCFQSSSGAGAFCADGRPCPPPPQPCKVQMWEVVARVSDESSGVSTTHVQGVTFRVPFANVCP